MFHIEYLIFIRFGTCFVLSSCRNTNSWKAKTNISWILITVPLISVVAPFTPTHVKKHRVEWHFTDVQYTHCKREHSLLFIYMLILSAPLWHRVKPLTEFTETTLLGSALCTLSVLQNAGTLQCLSHATSTLLSVRVWREMKSALIPTIILLTHTHIQLVSCLLTDRAVQWFTFFS